jgi:NAD(P)-dependent dehydrogenase (short-subunit alcohol dehydrogenase family)
MPHEFADIVSSPHPGTIFITGTSSGLGRASAKLFSSRGWTVIATMRTPSKETELTSLPNVVLLALDITDPQQIVEAAHQALGRGEVDVVFNNAGYGMAGPLEGVTDEQMLRMVHTNLMGPIRITKAFTPHFREKRGDCSSIRRQSAASSPSLSTRCTTRRNGPSKGGAKGWRSS